MNIFRRAKALGLALAALFTAAAMPASAAITYLVSGTLGTDTFSFETSDDTLLEFSLGLDITATNVVINGTPDTFTGGTLYNASNGGGFGFPNPTIRLETTGPVLYTGIDPNFALTPGTYNVDEFAGPRTGTITIALAPAPAGPGAPAPLLGLGLVPALAGVGGLAATRRRRKLTL